MSVTEKDRKEANTIIRLTYNEFSEILTDRVGIDVIAGIIANRIAHICDESVDQARKEAADIQCSFCERRVQCKLPEFCQKRSAILGDTPANEPKQTDAEKLPIAVKALRWALEYIGDGHLPDEGTPDHACGYEISPDKGYCDFCENYWNARNALKEIQG